MDPTANLKEQIQIAESFIAWADGKSANDYEITAMEEEGIRLAELVIALAEWNARTK